ncbi:sensor box histidine kinase (plasmid) [Natrialba magadii ATCC 43099]|uniref:histidine kinase n=1 Tax=Natrialba magadii (strain ATCC 43099 / DSM 3394 / CCM 3739 / CIP 104546 / IAM 13178 / JCM 8861 / NBRC 102185 / NCIMB 2190 / MS3) TaxID=547559 RepID=D3T213_NATMM|nr:PAS domain-containing protein [Natrialba magadii]ADD07622.1 sensor box histidine kinase [Natrialba magadii ATCC 43099]ELY27099.1 PAS/PAC sensor signal transduction histidine kinase [Natrialba magadii ATCC 43099]
MSSTPLTDTLRETLATFEEGGAPQTTTEVAEQFDLGRRSAYERLERLVDHDQLETKKVGGNGRVWWRPATVGGATTQDAVDSDLGKVFDRISDSFYALDEELRFRYLNDTAADLFGLDEGAIGSDIRNENVTETYENALCEALETQEPVTFEDYYPPLDKWFQNVIYSSESGLSVYTRNITERKRREQELARYETIVETSPIGITIVDSDGKMQFANDRAEEIYGRSKAQINDLSFDDSDWNEVDVDSTPLPDDEKPFPQIIESKDSVFDHVSGVSRPDGERVWVSVNGAPVYDERGEIESVVFSIEDVTERRERQRALEESERRYRTLAENFQNGLVTQFDEELRYTLAAGQAFDYLPHSPDDVEGQHLHEVWDTDVADTIEPVYQTVLEGEKQSIEGTSEGCEWIVQVVPLTDQDGEIHGGTAIALDITERKERERALEESERRYRTLAENFPNGAVGLFDDDLRYTAVGGELLDTVGVSPEDWVGNSVYDTYPDELVEEVKQYFEAALEGKMNSFEVEYHNRNLFVNTLPVRNVDDEVYAGMLVVQDVTERREYQRKLEASNERLEQFAYAVSHDLQEPLRMVTSYLQLLDQRYGDALGEDGEEFIEFAVDGAERMRAMIDGLLEYSRVETQGEPFEPVDLDAILEEVRDDLQLRIAETEAEITADDLPTVAGDASQLRQVFQNLLNNAIEYSGDEPPRIDIDAERVGGQWQITVSDHGIGINPDNQDRVFEVFQRLHTSNEHPGTGIGLALCQRIVERHDGELWVESEPGDGSAFSFTLPVP